MITAVIRRGVCPAAVAAILLASQLAGQSKPAASEGDLFRTLAALDRELFASASYDGCDLEKFKSFFADDVEFYHDQGGLTTGTQTLTEQVKKNLCGIVKRELVAGTMEVYPMHGYGAVQTGVHRFYRPKESPDPTGVAKFIHLWQNRNGAWKITRVISYDHKGLSK